MEEMIQLLETYGFMEVNSSDYKNGLRTIRLGSKGPDYWQFMNNMKEVVAEGSGFNKLQKFLRYDLPKL